MVTLCASNPNKDCLQKIQGGGHKTSHPAQGIRAAAAGLLQEAPAQEQHFTAQIWGKIHKAYQNLNKKTCGSYIYTNFRHLIVQV